ncbi:hypothetical protein GQX74_004061 [Glossina fuscipes]|nr:hypothetical protein GQX74_004061 [Glossina fuscipes]
MSARKIGNEKHQTGNKITRKLSTDSQKFSRKRIFTQHVNYASDLNDKKNNNKNNSNNANSHNNIKKVGRHFDRLPAGYELEHRRTYKFSNEKIDSEKKKAKGRKHIYAKTPTVALYAHPLAIKPALNSAKISA